MKKTLKIENNNFKKLKQFKKVEEKQFNIFSIKHSNLFKNKSNVKIKIPKKKKSLTKIEKLILKNNKINFNDLSHEDENLNITLNQARFSIDHLKSKLNILKSENNSMNKKIYILQSSNKDLNNKLSSLYEQNYEFNNLYDKRDNLKYINYNENNNFNEIKQLNKYQYLNQKNKENKNEINSKENKNYLKYPKKDKEIMELKNNKMNDIIKPKQKLKEFNDCLDQKREIELKNKNLIINRLKSEINLLKNNLFKYQQEKIKIKKIFENGKIIDDNKIYDLSTILDNLINENEKLKANTFKNKKINTKLNEEKILLINKIKKMTRDLNEINLNIIRQQKKDSKKKNIIYSNILLNENNKLKQIKDKYKKILYILFQFLNELNFINDNREIEIEQSYNNISLLIDNINLLRNDILELLEQKSSNYDNNYNQNKNWENMDINLFSINNINNENFD